MDLYEKIISLENISHAYFKILEKFDTFGKSNSYVGYDGRNLNSYNLNSLDLIKEIQKELMEASVVDIPLKLSIPKKKKKGYRDVFVHNVKERIKNQAVYQVIEPVAEEIFSDYLYSYRSTHPHYRAVKSIAGRYRKKFKDDFVLIGDVTDYTDNIDQKILKDKLEKENFDIRTRKILNLFINRDYLKGGKTHSEALGISGGMPTTALFANLYLDEMDKRASKICSMYRRVGDDFIVFDTYENLLKVQKVIEGNMAELNLPKNKYKLKIQKAEEDFDFLGYKFSGGLISIMQKSVTDIRSKLRSRLRYYRGSLRSKRGKVINILYRHDPLLLYFISLLNHYNQVNDWKQIKEISDYFFTRLTVYFFGKINEKNKRLTMEVVREMKLPSFYKYYLDFHTGKRDLREMRQDIHKYKKKIAWKN